MIIPNLFYKYMILFSVTFKFGEELGKVSLQNFPIPSRKQVAEVNLCCKKKKRVNWHIIYSVSPLCFIKKEGSKHSLHFQCQQNSGRKWDVCQRFERYHESPCRTSSTLQKMSLLLLRIMFGWVVFKSGLCLCRYSGKLAVIFL